MLLPGPDHPDPADVHAPKLTRAPDEPLELHVQLPRLLSEDEPASGCAASAQDAYLAAVVSLQGKDYSMLKVQVDSPSLRLFSTGPVVIEFSFP